MALNVIESYDDPRFAAVKEDFYSNFIPDDWDHIITGKTKAAVERRARQVVRLDYEIKRIANGWMAVTYHS